MRGVVRWLRETITGGVAPASLTLTAPAGSHDATLPAPAPLRSPLATGAMLGRYEVLGLLGTGGMGAVYEAHDPELDRRIAIKVVHARSADPEHARLRLRREAQTMAKLSHPNIANVLDIGRIDDRLFIAMELVRGGTLRGLVGADRPWREVLAPLLAAGRGLAAAHDAGVVHRDFKPDNVLVGTDGVVRVSDFGLSRSPSEANDDAFGGTPAYLAPECYAGAADGVSDQFAFAVTLYEVFEGERPYGATELAAYAREHRECSRRPWRGRLPLALRGVVERGLALDPAARWPSIDTMCSALERGARRRRAPWIAGAAMIAIAAAVIFTRSAGAAIDGAGCRIDNVPVELEAGGEIHLGGRDPAGIAVGHLDLDPHLDVVATYSFTRSISIWSGRGDGTLVPGPAHRVGHGAFAVAIAELDTDHRPDVIVAAHRERGSELAVLLGTAKDGDLAPPLRTTTACDGTDHPAPLQVVARDFDGDGRMDIAAANQYGGVCVLYGRGDGTFDRRHHLPVPGVTWSVATLDVDADGRPDLAATVRTGGAVIFRNTGTSFAEVGFVAAGTDSRAIAAGDLDRDGRDDFVIAHRADANISVHLAADEFRARFYPTFRFPDFVALADLNGDCRLDVAVTYSTGFEASHAFTVLRGVGDGTLLAAEHLEGGNQSSFAIGDLDGDRRSDIVIRPDLSAIPHASGTGGITVLRNVTP